MIKSKKALLLLALFFIYGASVPISLAQMAELGERAGKTSDMKESDPLKTGSDRILAGQKGVGDQSSGLQDHLAKVFDFDGDVRVLKHDSSQWMKAEKEMLLEVGDQILTGKKSSVDIVYDHFFLNIAKIEADTKAEFRSIEPTDLHLEDGTIFSALDGMAGNSYQISTPTAVAGVRGTTFDISFDAPTGAVDANVYPDASGHLGEILLTPLGEGGMLEAPLTLNEGQGFDNGTVGEIPQENLEHAQEIIEHVESNFGELRDEGIEHLETLNEGAGENEQAKTTASEKSEQGEEGAADEGDQKVGDKPNDGGDGDSEQGEGEAGGLGGGSSLLRNQGDAGGQKPITEDAAATGQKVGGELGGSDEGDSQVDSFIDATMVPPADAPIGDQMDKPEGANVTDKDESEEDEEGEEDESGTANSDKKADASKGELGNDSRGEHGINPAGFDQQTGGYQGPATEGEHRNVDFGQMMEFFALGGLDSGHMADMEGDHGFDFTGFFDSMGFAPEVSTQMAEGMTSMMENNNLDFSNFMGGDAFANMDMSQMGEMMGSMGEMGEHFQFGEMGDYGDMMAGYEGAFEAFAGGEFDFNTMADMSGLSPEDMQNLIQELNITFDPNQDPVLVDFFTQLFNNRFNNAMTELNRIDTNDAHGHTFFDHATAGSVFSTSLVQSTPDSFVTFNIALLDHNLQTDIAHINWEVRAAVGTPQEFVASSGTMHCFTVDVGGSTADQCTDGG